MPERKEIESPTSEQIIDTLKQGAEIYTAVNEFLEKGLYDSKQFFGSDGRKHRGYVYMIKK